MQTISMPRCERCIDGGSVQIIEVPDENRSIFQPRPSDPLPAHALLCRECGWTIPVEPTVQFSRGGIESSTARADLAAG